MVLTDFLRNLTSGNLARLAVQATTIPQTITGQVGDSSTSFQQAGTIFANILSGVGLPQTSQEIQTSLGISGLEQQTQNFTSAINELITVREQDIKKINENFRNFAIGQDVLQEQTPTPTETKDKFFDTLKTGFSGISESIGPIGIVAGLLIVGVILLKK